MPVPSKTNALRSLQGFSYEVKGKMHPFPGLLKWPGFCFHGSCIDAILSPDGSPRNVGYLLGIMIVG